MFSEDDIRFGVKIHRWTMGMRLIRQQAGQRPTWPTISRGSERKVPHIGTETRSKLLREAAVILFGNKVRHACRFVCTVRIRTG